jgi:1-deoxy-D-xylulose-5-phosphate synthase
MKHSITNLVAPPQTGVLFEQMGFDYVGPLDGHDLSLLIDVFRQVKQMQGPVLVHVVTQKGKGYKLGEHDPRKWHAVVPFEPETGQAYSKSSAPTYTSVFGETLVQLAEQDRRVVAITAAMPDGTGLNLFHDRFPDRYFDVGIAEGHAVCFAAGLAASGLRPVAAIYSTFLQRAYDMILHDVALQNLPVIFAIDRAGLVGEDGGTHHGAFDLTYLRSIPNLTILAPKDGPELTRMLHYCLRHVDGPQAGPIAVRYPRGAAITIDSELQSPEIEYGKAECLMEGEDVTLLAVGSMVQPVYQAALEVRADGIRCEVINARFVKPLDADAILRSVCKTGRLVVAEENTLCGGFGSAVLELLASHDLTHVPVRSFGIPDHFVEHGAPDILRRVCGLSTEDVATAVRELAAARGPRPTNGKSASSAAAATKR